MTVSLDLAKKHCQIDHSDDDDLISQYIDSAEESVAQYLRLDLSVDGWPSPCNTAVLILVQQSYDRRHDTEGDGTVSLPLMVRALLAPYRSFS